MNRNKAVSILQSIQKDYLKALDDGEGYNPDVDAEYAHDSNAEVIEALDIAIKELSKKK